MQLPPHPTTNTTTIQHIAIEVHNIPETETQNAKHNTFWNSCNLPTTALTFVAPYQAMLHKSIASDDVKLLQI
jgi:hypothetical protein